MNSAVKTLIGSLVIAAVAIPAISASQAAERHAVKKSPAAFASAQRGGGTTADGYPTLGKAIDACGHGNVFVMYEELPDGSTQNHSFHCVD